MGKADGLQEVNDRFHWLVSQWCDWAWVGIINRSVIHQSVINQSVINQ